MPFKIGRSIIWIIGLFPAALSLAQHNEIFTPAHTAHDMSAIQNDLGTELDLSFSGFVFSDTDMRQTYSYLPLYGAGLSFRIAEDARLVLALRYGHKAGDPYYNLLGFESDQGASLETLRYLMGLKYNLAHSSRIKVYAGYSLILAWTREDLPPQLHYSGRLDDSAADGMTTGFLLTFGPEWVLGKGDRAVGLEIGYGGTKGELSGEFLRHEIDLKGISGRTYFVFQL